MVQILNAELLILMQFVLVLLVTLEHLQIADLNVQLVQNVHKTKHVLIRNVSILVLERVAQTRDVMF